MNSQKKLDIAIIQSNLFWESPIENRNFLKKKIDLIANKTDLIVLPEMFTTGFSMKLSLAEKMDGETLKWMCKIAKNKNTAIVGSILITENKKFYNRLIFVKPNNEIFFYDKRHLFTLSEESHYLCKGDKMVIVNYKGWKINLQICYDLRFPVWSRNSQDYDILLYVANWPVSRINAWNILLKARAIENMCYVIGVNRLGTDANKNTYSGNSAIIDPLGFQITPIVSNKEKVIITSLSKTNLEENRAKYKFLEDRDTFKIIET